MAFFKVFLFSTASCSVDGLRYVCTLHSCLLTLIKEFCLLLSHHFPCSAGISFILTLPWLLFTSSSTLSPLHVTPSLSIRFAFVLKLLVDAFRQDEDHQSRFNQALEARSRNLKALVKTLDLIDCLKLTPLHFLSFCLSASSPLALIILSLRVLIILP